MGAGNYRHKDAKTVYIDHSEIFGDEPDDMFECQFLVDESLIPMIGDALPKSLCLLERKQQWWADNERKVIAESAMYRITLVDWHGYFALNVEAIEDQTVTPLALHGLDRTAISIFDALANRFELRVRTSGWTSGLYRPRQDIAA